MYKIWLKHLHPAKHTVYTYLVENDLKKYEIFDIVNLLADLPDMSSVL